MQLYPDIARLQPARSRLKTQLGLKLQLHSTGSLISRRSTYEDLGVIIILCSMLSSTNMMGDFINAMGQAMQADVPPEQFVFAGDFAKFSDRMDQTTPQQLHSVKKATLIITGSQVKTGSQCLLCFTCVAGCLLCLPFLACFCQCWKKRVFPSYEIPLRTYQKLPAIIGCPNLEELNIHVQDNALGHQKAQIICDQIKKSQVKKLRVSNVAGDYSSGEEECYSSFQDNFDPIKNIPHLISTITWGKVTRDFRDQSLRLRRG